MEYGLSSIKDHRKRIGLSQAEVAQRVGVDQTIVSRWERETAPVPAKHLERLAEIYGISVSQLEQWLEDSEEKPLSPARTWRDYVIDAGLSGNALLILLVIGSFTTDEFEDVVSFSSADLWKRAKMPEEARQAAWDEALGSGFLKRIGTGEWMFRLVLPHG